MAITEGDFSVEGNGMEIWIKVCFKYEKQYIQEHIPGRGNGILKKY